MSSSLPTFCGALVLAAWSSTSWAQTPLPLGQSPARAETPAAADSNSGDALLRHVIATVDALPAVAAKVRQRVDLLSRPLVGSGMYLQQGRGPSRNARLDLSFQLAQQAGCLQQVCDGANLWIYEELGEDKNLGWVDVARLGRARPKSQPAAASVNFWSALGGLPMLLSSVESAFQFGPVAESRLEDLRVFSIEGQWKPARLVQLLPDQKEAIESGKGVDLTKLAPNLPDRLVVHVGADDFFPYRIEYWRSHPAAQGAKSAGRGKLILLVEFYEVRFGAGIDAREFAFDQGQLKPVDRTQEFLDRLGLEDTVATGAGKKRPPRR